MSDTLQRLKDTEQEILDQIVDICEKHSIDYYLIGGTLLGSVRHKGFIPWDDDIDIVMPRTHYPKFIEACKQYLPDKYFVHDNDLDPLYWWAFPKVRKNGTIFIEANSKDIKTHKGIWVDIFLLDESKKNDGFFVKLQSLVSTYARSILATRRGMHKRVNGVGVSIVYALTRPFSIRTLSRWRDKILSYQNGKSGSVYYINFGSKYGYRRQTYRIDDYAPAEKGEFCGKFYNIPKNYHKVLTGIYGKDYMQLPPEEKRITHKPIRIDFGTESAEE